jgi:hypothetical protein
MIGNIVIVRGSVCTTIFTEKWREGFCSCSLPGILTLFAAHDSMEPYNGLPYESDERVEGM